MSRERLHTYAATVMWVGSSAGSTATYAGYSREYVLTFEGKDGILRGSADRAFRGDPTLMNPEDMLLASLSSCHLLSYLAVCALEGIEIVSYADRATAVMSETGGSGHFVSALLRPQVVVADATRVERALELHAKAHESCFVANSVNFPVTHEPDVTAIS